MSVGRCRSDKVENRGPRWACQGHDEQRTGAAKRTLDTLKRSCKIQSRSDNSCLSSVCHRLARDSFRLSDSAPLVPRQSSDHLRGRFVLAPRVHSIQTFFLESLFNVRCDLCFHRRALLVLVGVSIDIERHSRGCPLFTATLCHNSSQSDDPLDLRCVLNRARKPVGFLDESLGLARFQFRRGRSCVCRPVPPSAPASSPVQRAAFGAAPRDVSLLFVQRSNLQRVLL